MLRVDRDKSNKYMKTLYGAVMTTLQGTQLRLSLSVKSYNMSVDEVPDFVGANVAAYTTAQAGHRNTSARKPTTWARQFEGEWMDTPADDAKVTEATPAAHDVPDLHHLQDYPL